MVHLHLSDAGRAPRVQDTSTQTTMPGLRKRVILGFVIAPLAAPIAFDVMTGVESLGSGASPSLGVLGALFLVGYMAPYAYLATLLIGAPAYLLLRRYGTLSLWEMLLVGVAIISIVIVDARARVKRTSRLREDQSAGLVLVLGVNEGVFEIPDVESMVMVLHYSLKGLDVPYIRGVFNEGGIERSQLKEDIIKLLFKGLLK